VWLLIKLVGYPNERTVSEVASGATVAVPAQIGSGVIAFLP